MKLNNMLFRKIIALMLLTVSSGLAYSQNVEKKNLTWYSDQCTENHSGLQMNSDVKIIIRSAETVDLVIQEQSLNFTIKSITGTWNDVTRDGRLEYTLQYNGSQEGKMVIVKQSGATTISIDFTGTNPDGIDYDFLINRVEAN